VRYLNILAVYRTYILLSDRIRSLFYTRRARSILRIKIDNIRKGGVNLPKLLLTRLFRPYLLYTKGSYLISIRGLSILRIIRDNIPTKIRKR